MDSDRMAKTRNAVVRWYKKEGRNFPWRETSDPFFVLIAEMLLRRTTASAVLRVYDSFLSRFGTPQKLAAATERVIAGSLVSLGLQSIRARQMHETAILILSEYDGRVPDNNERLEGLPGVGKYAASAVLNFAFSHSVPMVDGNVTHLLNRVFSGDLEGPADPRAWELARVLGGRRQPKHLYWGIIDLVATICLRRTPRCNRCPLDKLCDYSKYRALQES